MSTSSPKTAKAPKSTRAPKTPKPARYRTRFGDADEEGFLAAASEEVTDVIGDFLREKNLQKTVNRRIITSETLKQIEEAEDASIGFGVFLDWRGRLYYNGAGLAPQGKDFGRGCLMAAEGKRLGISGLRHLMIGVATTWGQGKVDGISLDKAPLNARARHVAGMVENGSLAKIVDDSVNHTGFAWRLAEEPVQFLALAADLLAALASGNAFEYKSSVFIGYDATCSGLQVLAAVCRDLATALEVNVAPRPDGKRADIYMRGGEALMARCQEIVDGYSPAEAADAAVYLAILTEAEAEMQLAREEERDADPEMMQAVQDIGPGDHWALYWLTKGVTRNLMKNPVMVFCYGGGERTFTASFREESRAPWKACGWLAARLYRDVLPVLLPRAYAVMVAMQEMAKTLASLGKPVAFTAKDGLPFVQQVMETEKDRVRCHLYDDRSLYIVTQQRTNKINVQKQASGVAPNIVHHWDALFLRNAVRALSAAGIDAFYTVHDCFYLRAGDWAQGLKIIRQAFVDTFSGNVLADLWADIEETANGGPQHDSHLAAWCAGTGAEYAEAPKAIVLPACPDLGDLDLTLALKSEYLFS